MLNARYLGFLQPVHWNLSLKLFVSYVHVLFIRVVKTEWILIRYTANGPSESVAGCGARLV